MTYTPTPEDADALVALSRARGGVDPIGVALLLWIESAGFNPASMGPAGRGTVRGLNQMTLANLRAAGLDPDEWVTRTAAEQLGPIFRFWDGLCRDFNRGVFAASSEDLHALNFVPGRYLDRKAAANRDAPLVARGVPDGHDDNGEPIYWYEANRALDPDGTGAITVNTIARSHAIAAGRGDPRWATLRQLVEEATVRADPSSGPRPVPSSPPTSPPAPPPSPATPPAPPTNPAPPVVVGPPPAVPSPVGEPPGAGPARAAGLALAAALLLAAAFKGRALILAAGAALLHAGGC